VVIVIVKISGKSVILVIGRITPKAVAPPLYFASLA
jgi:hypothetical protein